MTIRTPSSPGHRAIEATRRLESPPAVPAHLAPSLRLPALACALGAVLVFGSTTPVEAQLPGARTAPRDRVRAEFISNVLGELNETRDAWADAVENDDVEPLVELYTEDAVVIPPDGIPRRGEEEIREYWAEALPRMGTFQTGLSDVDGSGRMVMAWGSYLLNERGDDNVFAQLSGSLMNVYVKTGGSWRIRGQVFGKPE